MFLETKSKTRVLVNIKFLAANKTKQEYREVASPSRQPAIALTQLTVAREARRLATVSSASDEKSSVNAARKLGVHSGEPSKHRISEERSRCREAETTKYEQAELIQKRSLGALFVSFSSAPLIAGVVCALLFTRVFF